MGCIGSLNKCSHNLMARGRVVFMPYLPGPNKHKTTHLSLCLTRVVNILIPNTIKIFFYNKIVLGVSIIMTRQ